ncbi:cysteine protease StiP family protein [Metabacillus sp. GX 13764]|uniref:cysteine protease StiP family protein n=1 Tax=Metabacillus kandeliae TaxID=2900151 RepID=UPI001E34D61D|nr:cysteine protease StiP family protein [Metabacillus kandeliae]MCD7034703.1 cysteine protease StiP family protein [Metabacillus kandeliae]
MELTRDRLPQPGELGSYSKKDVVFLLKDLSHAEDLEKPTMEREQAIQSGGHYSEMLPIEYQPSPEYLKLYYQSLEKYKEKLASAVGFVAEKILQAKGKNAVLVSLARAGTPIGILIKRYIQHRFQLDVPHYSISIIRGRGIDENAMKYILANHPDSAIQFVDGWTGKGAITLELKEAVLEFNKTHQTEIDWSLAVLADPGYCAAIRGTHEDFLIPSACLNSTVSGLVSRTVLNEKWIGPNDFHGAKYYNELKDEDVSNHFIDTVSNEFGSIAAAVQQQLEVMPESEAPDWRGLAEIHKMQKEFGIENVHHIKPGVGETTRVLLRRVPWKVLVKDMKSPELEHILLLAREKGVPVEEYQDMSYTCLGLIRSLK